MQIITVELIAAAFGGFLGALFTIASNQRKETLVEAILSLLVGIVFGSGAGTKWGAGDPVIGCGIAVIAGSIGGVVLEGFQKWAPEAMRLILFGWVERIGGKREASSEFTKQFMDIKDKPSVDITPDPQVITANTKKSIDNGK